MIGSPSTAMRALRGIDPRAEDADDFAVDGDSTLKDQLLTGAARAEPGVGQDFLKSLGRARLGIGEPEPACAISTRSRAANRHDPGEAVRPSEDEGRSLSRGAVDAKASTRRIEVPSHGRGGDEPLISYPFQPGASRAIRAPKTSAKTFQNSQFIVPDCRY